MLFADIKGSIGLNAGIAQDFEEQKIDPEVQAMMSA